MKKIHISTDRILLIMIAMLLWYSTLLQACESESDVAFKPELTIVKDDTATMKIHTSGRKRSRSYKK